MNDDELVLLAIPLDDVPTIAGLLMSGSQALASAPIRGLVSINSTRRDARTGIATVEALLEEADWIRDRRQHQHATARRKPKARR